MAFMDMWSGWIVLAGAALGLATMLSAIVYMLSELLQNDKMKGWAKIELSEVFYSAVIISLAIFGLPLIDSVVQGSLGVSNAGGGGGGTLGCAGSTTSAWIPTIDYGTASGSKHYQCLDICGPAIASDPNSVYNGVESCHMRLGIWYMREIFDEAKSFAFDIYTEYIYKSMAQDFTINIEFLFEKAGFFTFTPWRGFFTIPNKIRELVFDWAIKLMMLTKFQEVMLKFIAVALFPALFVAGAVLRTFTFTRRLGGLLLAMAIALYFIFPAFYAFGALIMLNIKNDPAISSEWLHNRTINPLGAEAPDPPIANTMYTSGNISMIGGGKTGYDVQEAKDSLRYYEGLDSETYARYMESGKDSYGNSMLPQFDLTSNAYDTASDDEKDAAYARAYDEGKTWKEAEDKKNKIDKLNSFAWLPNGPIDTLSRITFWSVFFSLFSVIGTIAGIRSLSNTFGGDIEIAGLTRLI